jgi:hypothetical protein
MYRNNLILIKTIEKIIKMADKEFIGATSAYIQQI